MKALQYLFVLCLCTLTFCATAEPRHVTLSLSGNQTTNEVSISDFETAKVVSAFDPAGIFQLEIHGSFDATINGDDLAGYPSGYFWKPRRDIVVKGPALFRLKSSPRSPANGDAFITLEITPASFPPDKTLVVEPNQGNVAITLQGSTNLLNWSTATNAIYGTTNQAQFFRIKMDKLN